MNVLVDNSQEAQRGVFLGEKAYGKIVEIEETKS